MTATPRSDSTLARRLLPWTPFALAAALFVALAAYHRFHMGDDGFIYYRYVANLVAGHGPVWNVGEHPVEGYSSPLWLGLLALGPLIGADVIVWSRWLGIVMTAVSVAGVGVLARRMGAGVFVSGLAVLATSLIRGLYFWAPAGLETPLDTALVVWACAFLVDPRPSQLWTVPVALLGIARPEGPFLAVLGLFAAIVARGRQAVTWREIAIVLAPSLGWQAFRLAYYGAPLSNTYYAKATGTLRRQLRLGLRYGGWAAAPLLIGWTWALRLANRRALAILLLISTQLALTIGGGGDWMSNHRLLLPVLLPLLGCAAGLAAEAEVVRSGIVAAVVTVLTLIPVLTSPATLMAALRGETLPLSGWQEGGLVATSRTAAAWIARHYPEKTVIAVNHAGVAPYRLLSFTAIDMTGLNDAHIARDVPGGLHQKFDPDYVLGKRPRLILLNSHVEPGQEGIWYHRGYWEGETALVDRLEFRRWYRPVRYWTSIAPGGGPGYILLFERTDEPMTLLGD